MKTKREIINQLTLEFQNWKKLLDDLDENSAKKFKVSNGHSVKDVVGHVCMWQKVSIARLAAALHGSEPHMPDWHPRFDPKDDQERDAINEYIYTSQKNKSWREIKGEWEEGFKTFLDLANQIPEDDYFDKDKFNFLFGYTVADVLVGSFEHYHTDHYPEMVKALVLL